MQMNPQTFVFSSEVSACTPPIPLLPPRSHPCLQDPQSQFPCSELNCVVLINISVSEGILSREIRTFSSLSPIKSFSMNVYISVLIKLESSLGLRQPELHVNELIFLDIYCCLIRTRCVWRLLFFHVFRLLSGFG